jgi:hypothetical protein
MKDISKGVLDVCFIIHDTNLYLIQLEFAGLIFGSRADATITRSTALRHQIHANQTVKLAKILSAWLFILLSSYCIRWS